MRWDTALVTGASSGIGRAIAVQLARRGVDLVLVARSRQELNVLAAQLGKEHGVAAEVLAADLADDADVKRVQDRLGEHTRPIDLLVNNAGVGSVGPIADVPLLREEHVVRVNVLAVLRLSRVAAEQMRRRGRGTIVNMASLAAYGPIPFFATYAASKAFVYSLSLAMREELRDTGVSLTVVCPGFVDTDFGDKAGVRNPALRWLYADAERIARDAVDGAETGRAVVLPGSAVRAASVVSRFAPPAMIGRIAGSAARSIVGGALREAAANAGEAPAGPPPDEHIDLDELGDAPVHG